MMLMRIERFSKETFAPPPVELFIKIKFFMFDDELASRIGNKNRVGGLKIADNAKIIIPNISIKIILDWIFEKKFTFLAGLSQVLHDSNTIFSI